MVPLLVTLQLLLPLRELQALHCSLIKHLGFVASVHHCQHVPQVAFKIRHPVCQQVRPEGCIVPGTTFVLVLLNQRPAQYY